MTTDGIVSSYYLQVAGSHQHAPVCAHDLNICTQCDVVWCGKCSKQWGASASVNQSPFGTTTTWPLPSDVYRITCHGGS